MLTTRVRLRSAHGLAWAWLAVSLNAHATDDAANASVTAVGPAVAQNEVDLPTPQELEAAGAVIGTIHINNENIFDLTDPREDRRLYRLANKVHVRTRKDVIREQLLIAPGEPFSVREIEESERILRMARYLYDAKIRPVAWHDGVADVEVTTRDVWTLNPGVSFGRKGGKSTSGFQLDELNVLGTGIGVGFAHNSDVDRDSTSMQLKHPHLWDGHTILDTTYADTSDGRARYFSLDRPFYALDTHGAVGGFVGDEQLIHHVYDEGHTRSKFYRDRRYGEIYGGTSNGLVGNWVQRWTFGVTADERRFSDVASWTGVDLVPEDRKFFYPWIGFEVLQDRFHEFKNHDQIGRTEDFYLGTRFSGRIGWAGQSLGSTENAVMFRAEASHAKETSARSTMLFSSTLHGRLANGDWQNTVLSGAVRYYLQQTKKALLFATVDGAAGHDIDLDEQMLLGGDTGLRGYPLRYQSGDARALFTIEQRYFTDWYPWRLFRIGGAAFFDMGRTWGQSPLGTDSQGILKDVGVGLRIGSSRSGLGNVIHVDVAMPLDGDSSIENVQLLIETLERF